MKNVLRISVLVLIALFMLPGDADAQRYGKKKKKKKKKKTEQKSESSFNLQDRLWYGASGTLRFGGTNSQNEFSIGISPMVGYKFNNWLSAGPRAELSYTSGRVDFGFSNIITYNQFDYGGGLFARAKSPFGIYFHTEYIVLGDECLTDQNGICAIENPSRFGGVQITLDDTLETKRLTRDSYLIGLGYNSAGFSKFGYEIQLNYDLLAPDDVVSLPIDLRVGLTYNF